MKFFFVGVPKKKKFKFIVSVYSQVFVVSLLVSNDEAEDVGQTEGSERR